MDVREEVSSRLEGLLESARTAVGEDGGASPVLAAVLAEFERKYRKTVDWIVGPDPTRSREGVIELEQAADSAKAAALADTGAADATREAVVVAHDTICYFKSTGDLLPEGVKP